MEPTLKKLDGKKPEVKALMDFARDIQMLSDVENSTENVELEEMPILPMCEALMDEIRNRVKSDVVVTLNVPKTEAKINKTYVEYVLRHLLRNAAEYAPEGGKVTLDYKKRGPHSHQFLVTNTGDVIPEEKRDDLFKPFREIKDLTDGDGLGLPICKQMALKMNGDLEIDPTFTKGMRFVLNLHV
jgi:signal transduction histidine kinase